MWPFKKKEEEYCPVQNNPSEVFKGLGDVLEILSEPEEPTPTLEDRVKDLENFKTKALLDIASLQRRMDDAGKDKTQSIVPPVRKPKRRK